MNVFWKLFLDIDKTLMGSISEDEFNKYVCLLTFNHFNMFRFCEYGKNIFVDHLYELFDIDIGWFNFHVIFLIF